MNTGVSARSTLGRSDRVVTGCWLLCGVGGRSLAIALSDVLEVMRPLPVQTLPGMPPFVRGMAMIRGRVAPVIDASTLIGATDSSPSRFVSLSVTGRIVVLAVDRVIGVETLSDDDVSDLPPLVSAERDVFAAIGTLDAELLLVLDSAHLVPDSVWTQLDQVATS
jgi:purine-binding chemotaxis protein CheW